jgi:hypothetical protein
MWRVFLHGPKLADWIICFGWRAFQKIAAASISLPDQKLPIPKA